MGGTDVFHKPWADVAAIARAIQNLTHAPAC